MSNPCLYNQDMSGNETFDNFGDFTYWGHGFTVGNMRNTKIGKFCSIAHNVILGPGQHEPSYLTTNPITLNGFFNDFPPTSNIEFIKHTELIRQNQPNRHKEPIIIGNDVWIGNNVTVQDGITVGDGAILATSAVVTHDVPPYAIVGGVPAKIIKYRFSPEIIADLLEIRWWDLPHEFIATLPFHDVTECIELYRQFRLENNPGELP